MVNILSPAQHDYLEKLVRAIADTTGYGEIIVRIKMGHPSITSVVINVELPHEHSPGSRLPDCEDIQILLDLPRAHM